MKSKQQYTRWSNWENAVLANCGDLPVLQDVINKRRIEINGDTQEAEMLREQVVEFVRLSGEDPETAYVKIKIGELYHFLRPKYPQGIGAINKVKAFVERHHVPEIIEHKKVSSGAVFVYRGAGAKPDAKLRQLRGRRKD